MDPHPKLFLIIENPKIKKSFATKSNVCTQLHVIWNSD